MFGYFSKICLEIPFLLKTDKELGKRIISIILSIAFFYSVYQNETTLLPLDGLLLILFDLVFKDEDLSKIYSSPNTFEPKLLR
jgi:hypothetical protein